MKTRIRHCVGEGGNYSSLLCEQTKGLVHELIVMNIDFEVFKATMQ